MRAASLRRSRCSGSSRMLKNYVGAQNIDGPHVWVKPGLCGPASERDGQPEADERFSFVHSLISLAPCRRRPKPDWPASPVLLPPATRWMGERS